MAKESDSFAKNLAISVITGLFTIGAEVVVAYLVPQVQNPIIVNNNVVISTDDYEKAVDRIQELEEELNELRPVNSNENSSTGNSATFGVSSRAILKDKPGSSSNYSQSGDTNAKDTAGNRYDPNHWGIIGSCSACSGFADYYLGGNYSKLSITIAPSSTNIDGKDNSTSFEILVKYKGDSDFRCIHTEKNISKSTSPIQLENLDISGAEWIEFKAIENVDEGHLNGNVLMIADAIVG